MLFARREMKQGLDFGLSQRFTNHISRYFTANKVTQMKTAEPISIPASYALIGESESQLKPDELKDLKETIQHIIDHYHNKTGKWLTQEQVAFSAVWQDSKQQATPLKERFRHSNLTSPTLQHHTNSPLRLSLIAQALQVDQFTITNPLSESDLPCSCSQKLNLPLDEADMSELESIGREVKQRCEQTLTQQGIDLDNIQACWQLKLHYEGSDNILVLKCMPREMLREVFVSEYLQQFGTPDDGQPIIIDELKIKVRLLETNSNTSPRYSSFIERWLTQWNQTKRPGSIVWNKQNDSTIQEEFSWLDCPVLEEIITKQMTKQASTEMPNLFITNHQKDVDEVVRRN